MEEITINRHSFHDAIEDLNEKIKKRPEDVAVLPQFQEKSLKILSFEFLDRNITGKEMNSFVATLQDTLIDSNIILEGALNEIKSIYTALDKLDKDYIDGILDAINKAKNAINKAEKSLTQVKKNSEQNTKTLQALKLTVEQFKSFRNEVNQTLPLIPKHTEALDKLSRVVDKTSSIVSVWDKQLVQFQKDTEDKAAKELATAKNQLSEAITKSQKDAEDKAAKELASAKNQLGEAITKSQKDVEDLIAKELALVKESYQTMLETNYKLNRKLLWAIFIGGLGLMVSAISLLLTFIS